MNLTGWYAEGQQPVRSGWYDRRYHDSGWTTRYWTTRYWWDNKRRVWRITPGGHLSAYAGLAWRGVRK